MLIIILPMFFNSKGSTFERSVFMIIDKTALTLVIIGAINWGLLGLFKFDLVAWLFGGQGAIISRIIYTIIAIAGIWAISILFKDTDKCNNQR